MGDARTDREKLEIIINTEVDMMLLWGHSIMIHRPYNICLNSENEHKNLRIEFLDKDKMAHAMEFYNGIKAQTEHGSDLKASHYHDAGCLTEGVKLKIPVLEYNLRIV